MLRKNITLQNETLFEMGAGRGAHSFEASSCALIPSSILMYRVTVLSKNIMVCCKTANTQDSVIMFASTSKITRAGSGISFIAASPEKLSHF